MIVKKETCRYPGCPIIPINNGLCWKHQNEEPVKKENKPDSQIKLFKSIWQSKPHECFVTKKNLDKYYNTKLWLNLFAHILRKSTYGKWKLKEFNIVLLSPEVHSIYDNPTYDSIKQWEKETGFSMEPLFLLESKLHDDYINEFNVKIFKRKICQMYTS